MSTSLPPEDKKESVSRLIHAPAEAIFALLTDVQRHTELDGSSTLKGEARGPARLSLGAEFSLGMQQSLLSYRSTSRVVEFEENRRITWRSGFTRGETFVVGGQGWRWDLDPQGEGDTLVTHTYLWGWARASGIVSKIAKPAEAAKGMRGSLANLARAIETPDGAA